jgi:hypothetical protein
MKKKMRKFSEGGFETKIGKNSNIDEDTRARAMRSVMPDDSPAGTTGYGEQNDLPETKTVTKTTVSKAPAVKLAPPMPAEEKARIEGIQKKQELIPVRPEEMLVPGGGGVKALQVAGTKLASKIAAERTAKEAAQAAVKKQTRRSEEGFNPSEAMDALKPTRTRTIKGKDVPVRQGKPNFSGTADNVGVKTITNKSGKKIPVKKQKEDAGDGGSGAFKRGGSVSSASRRADGCAIRGKTRA